TGLSDQFTDEDTPTPALAFLIADAETAAGSLTLTGHSSNAALVPDGNIVFGGSGPNRTVTVTPAANRSGTAMITVTVADPQVSTATGSFLLTVNLLYNPPSTLTGLSDQVTDEDTAMPDLAFSIGDVETAPGSLTLTGHSSDSVLVPDSNIVFGGSGSNRTVMVTPAANRSGTAMITVTVADPEG